MKLSPPPPPPPKKIKTLIYFEHPHLQGVSALQGDLGLGTPGRLVGPLGRLWGWALQRVSGLGTPGSLWGLQGLLGVSAQNSGVRETLGVDRGEEFRARRRAEFKF